MYNVVDHVFSLSFLDITAWVGLPDNLDAAVAWNGNNYFFKACTAFIYIDVSQRVERTLDIPETLKGPCNIDAEVNWGYFIYLFKENSFYNYSNLEGTFLKGPSNVSSLDLNREGKIDAAVKWHVNKINYLIKGTTYYKIGNVVKSSKVLYGWPGLYESELMPKCGCGCTTDTIGDFLKSYWEYEGIKYETNLGESTINCSNILKKHMIDNRNRLFKSEEEFTVSGTFGESMSFTHKDGMQIPHRTHFWVPVPNYSNNVIEADTEALQNVTYGKDKLTLKEYSFIVNCPSIDKFKTMCTVVA